MSDDKPIVLDCFRVDIPGEELRAHFTKLLSKVTEELDKIENSRIQLVGEKGAPPQLLKMKKNRKKLLSYVLDHLPQNVTYRLTMNELDGLFVLRDLTDDEE